MVEELNFELLAKDNIRTLEIPGASFDHPVCVILAGLPGSGKSFLVKKLKAKFPLVVLEEETMTAFLAPRANAVQRGREKVLELAVASLGELVRQGKACIFDGSVQKEKERDYVREKILEKGGYYLLIYLTTPKEVCYKRLKRENLSAGRGASKGFVFDRDAFEYESANLQVPSVSEKHIRYDGVTDDSFEAVVSVLKDLLKV